MAPIKDPIVDLYQKWGVVVANMMKHNPEGLEPINPELTKAKAKKLFAGKSKQEQLGYLMAAQLGVVEAKANLEAMNEVFSAMNHQ
jgi:hypothetical protein